MIELQSILSEKTISGRKKILQRFKNEHSFGELTDEEDKIMKYLFEEYYTPDPGHSKYPIEDIDRFYIGYGMFNSICFRIRLKDGFDDVATYTRLAGENRTQNQNLNRALRKAIEPQIEDFKRENPLIATNICPLKQTPLGNDAQVDHNPPFYKLVEEWLQQNQNPKVIWGPKGTSIYLLEEPFQTSWRNFHKEKANLRWLSKEGNKKAHLQN